MLHQWFSCTASSILLLGHSLNCEKGYYPSIRNLSTNLQTNMKNKTINTIFVLQFSTLCSYLSSYNHLKCVHDLIDLATNSSKGKIGKKNGSKITCLSKISNLTAMKNKWFFLTVLPLNYCVGLDSAVTTLTIYMVIQTRSTIKLPPTCIDFFQPWKGSGYLRPAR